MEPVAVPAFGAMVDEEPRLLLGKGGKDFNLLPFRRATFQGRCAHLKYALNTLMRELQEVAFKPASRMATTQAFAPCSVNGKRCTTRRILRTIGWFARRR